MMQHGVSLFQFHQIMEDFASIHIDMRCTQIIGKFYPKDKVPSNVYIAVRLNDNKIVGIIDLRHHINHPILSTWRGHIGYYVRPSERKSGYATEMLRQNLLNCHRLGIEKVLITCDANNYASEKTIIANGGVFEQHIEGDGEIMKRFWITI